MGELAMPNVLSTQIARLCLFESCYPLPLISKVAGDTRARGMAKASPWQAQILTIMLCPAAKTQLRCRIKKKKKDSKHCVLLKLCKAHFSVLQNHTGNLRGKILQIISALLVLFFWKCHVIKASMKHPGAVVGSIFLNQTQTKI